MIRELLIIYLAAASVNAFAQTDNRMQYRNMVLDYNQDVKSAEHSEAISAEMKKAAKADFSRNCTATLISTIRETLRN